MIATSIANCMQLNFCTSNPVNTGVLSLWDASKAKCIYKTKEIEKDSTKEESDAGLHTLTQCGFVKATDSIFTVSADGNLSVYSRKDLHLQKQVRMNCIA